MMTKCKFALLLSMAMVLTAHAQAPNAPAVVVTTATIKSFPLAVEALVRKGGNGIDLVIPRWGLEQKVKAGSGQGLSGILHYILEQLELDQESMTIEVIPHVPRAMGLGGSSALAVAIIRAIDAAWDLSLSNEQVNRLAYECEKAAHGTPSGIDNTIATYGTPLLYQRNATQDGEGGAADARFDTIKMAEPLPLVIGITGRESLTANTVARVRHAWEMHQARYDGIFDQIAALTRAGVDALRDGHFREIGELMNLCHGYLNALQLSTPELEELVHIARTNGALGAKLTGGGGGGSMIALCPDTQDQVAAAMEAAGYKTLQVMPG